MARPARAIRFRASDSVLSRRSGTIVSCGLMAMVSSTLDPASTVLPSGGTWLMTVPTVAELCTKAACSAERPTADAAWLASWNVLPIRFGTWTCAAGDPCGDPPRNRNSRKAASASTPTANSAEIHIHGPLPERSSSSASAGIGVAGIVDSRSRVGPRDAGGHGRRGRGPGRNGSGGGAGGAGGTRGGSGPTGR